MKTNLEGAMEKSLTNKEVALMNAYETTWVT
jgi:hypothetical protein